MRGIFFAIPALLALADGAAAEPQRLGEDQLGGVTAGQDLGGSGWPPSLSQPASPTDGMGSSPAGHTGSWTVSLQKSASPGEMTSSPLQSTASQMLTSTSSNISHANSTGLPGSIANGWATSTVTGVIGSPAPGP